jgi:hypothetical protein
MFLPGVSLKVKLLGIAVLAILTASMVGSMLAAVNQVVAEEEDRTPVGREPATSIADFQRPASDDSAALKGLKFVCPFH